MEQGGHGSSHLQHNPHSESLFDWWQKVRIALSSLTFPKRLVSFSPAVTSVNFISKWDLEGLGLKSALSILIPPHIMIFSRVQDLNAGEIMSASHYCKLYPPFVPITQLIMNLNTPVLYILQTLTIRIRQFPIGVNWITRRLHHHSLIVFFPHPQYWMW